MNQSGGEFGTSGQLCCKWAYLGASYRRARVTCMALVISFILRVGHHTLLLCPSDVWTRPASHNSRYHVTIQVGLPSPLCSWLSP